MPEQKCRMSTEPYRDVRDDGLRLLAAIIECVPDIILVKDADTLRLVLTNRAGEQFFGVPRARLLGKSDHDLLPVEQADAFASTDRAVLAAGESVAIPGEEILSPSRGMRVMHTTKFPIADESGTPRYLVSVSRDITGREDARDRNDLERQLQEARRMEAIGHLAGGIAHDFNNLLTVIMGAGALLLDEVAPERPERRDIEDIVASAQHGAALTRQLLAFMRREMLEPRVLDLNGVVANIERLLRRLIGEDVQLLTVRSSEDSLVRADPGQLEQVIANLAINARDAMPGGGAITLSVENVVLDDRFVCAHPGSTPGPHVKLSVTDTGTGMSQAVKARLFEPYFSTKAPGSGTGLGLSTVFGIVQQSEGFIAADSELGRGSTFRIYLPRVLSFERSPQAEPPNKTVLRGSETIVLVEDDAMVRELAARALRGYGYTVLAAPDGHAATKLAAAHPAPIHLLVTDVVLSGQQGMALANEMIATRPAVRVLFVSGYSDDKLSSAAPEVRGVALLQKPFTPTELARKIREVLDGEE
jgi:two-component system, cell cycle sensor histidine kinase and response regulator CckA